MPRPHRPKPALMVVRTLFVTLSLAGLTLALIPHPPRLLAWDKAEHFLAGAIIALFALPALPGLALGWLIGGLALSAALVEVLQAIGGAGRSGDPVDWLAGVLGAVLAVAVCHLAARLTSRVQDRARRAAD